MTTMPWLIAGLAAWGIGAWRVLAAAVYGSAGHRPPRVALGVAMLGLALTYAVELASSAETVMLWRRSFGIVVAATLIWTAETGKRYARRERRAQAALLRISEGDSA